MTRLDWDKAKRRQLATGPRYQRELHDFAKRHKLACFVCKDDSPLEWGKTGINARGPWAICLNCVRRPR